VRIARAITKDAFYIFSSQIARKLVHFVFVAVAARLLGAEGYGQYLLVATMVLVVTAFANFGIRPLVVRRMSKDREQTDEILSNVLVVRTGFATLAYLGLLGFVHVAGYDQEVQRLTAIAGLAIFVRVAQDSVEAVLQAHQRMKLLGVLAAISSAVSTFVGVAVLWAGLGLGWLFVSNVVTEAFFLVVTAVVIWIRVTAFRPRFQPEVARAILVGCLPFLAAYLLGFMDTKVDILLLSLVKGPVASDLAIGYYGPVHTILMAVMLVPRSLNQVLIPVISQKIYVDQAFVRETVERATKFIILTVSFPMILVTTMFPVQIVTTVFGAAFAPAAPALAILGWAYGFFALNLPSHSILGSTREMRYFLPVLLGSFLLNVGLDAALIPRYSFVGAAMGSVIVLALGFLGRFYYLHRILDMRLDAARSYLRLFFVLFATLAAAHAARPYLPAAAVAGLMALVYCGLVYAVGAVDLEEWHFVKDLLGRIRRRGRTVEATAGEGPGAGIAKLDA